MAPLKSYVFKHWQDGDPASTKSLNLLSDQSLIATYVEVIHVANIIFSGAQTAQAADGETVTITVTKPDGTTEILTATTLADKTYSTTTQYTVPGQYSGKAHGNADAQYSAWDSTVVPFTVSLLARTGTLVVTLT